MPAVCWILLGGSLKSAVAVEHSTENIIYNDFSRSPTNKVRGMPGPYT